MRRGICVHHQHSLFAVLHSVMVSISLKVTVGNNSPSLRLHFLRFKSSIAQEMTLQELLKNDEDKPSDQGGKSVRLLVEGDSVRWRRRLSAAVRTCSSKCR